MAIKRHIADVDELISLIYQGPLESPPWTSFLKCLRIRLDCDITVMALRLSKVGSAPSFVLESGGRIKEEFFKDRDIYDALTKGGNPLNNALLKPGDMYTLHEVTTPEELQENEYHNKYSKKIGAEYQLGMFIDEPGGSAAKIGAWNGADKGNFGAEEKAFFRAFRPHLERALHLYALNKRNESEKRIYKETLDHLAIGAFILDGTCRIIDANKAARDIVRISNAITIATGRLGLSNSADNTRLKRGIKAALAWREGNHKSVSAEVIRVQCAEGTNLGILIRPIVRCDPFENDASPSVIVYVRESTQQQLASERFVAELFQLTPAEALLATSLANGMTLIQAAKKLSVTEHTARSQLKTMFIKTGVARQVELVRLILTSVALLG